jgi:hypothetical protein
MYRACRMGETERVTVEYVLADGTLDAFIADVLEVKLRLINAVEADELLNTSVLDELYAKLRSLGPALLQENKALQATGEIRDRLEALAIAARAQTADTPLLETGVHEFKSSRNPNQVYRVTFGRAGHLECTCERFSVAGKLQTCSNGQGKLRFRALASNIIPALLVLRDGALRRQQMLAVPSWHRRRLPPPRLRHRCEVGAAGDKVLAHTHPRRMSRNHRGIDVGLSGHVFQKAGNLAGFEGRRLRHTVLADRAEHRTGGDPGAVQPGPQGRGGPR